MKIFNNQPAAVLTLAGLIALGGLVHAQTADEPSDGPDGTDDVTLPMERQADISPEQMADQSGKLVESMRKVEKQVIDLQQTAKKQKDILRLNCVNDKLAQIKQLIKIADAAAINLSDAIARRDDGGRYHEFGKIVIAEQQARVVAGEAENCVGEEIVFIGPTEVETDQPDLPDDPTGDSPDVDIEPPGYASPFA